MNNPLISVLVPVYGVERFIERCAVSLFEQSYQNLEYIFVDDCGKDNSIQILRDVVTRYPEREKQVSIIRHEHNRGLAGARNTAVAAAHGEFVIHVDSDDFLDLKTIEKLYNKQVEDNYDIVSCEFLTISSQGETCLPVKDYPTKEDFIKAILRVEDNTNIVSRLIRLSLYRDYDIKLDELSDISEDFQTTSRIFYNARKVAVLHEALYKYSRENEGSLTFQFNERLFRGDVECKVLKDFFQDKEPEYMDAIQYGIVNRIVKGLVCLAQTKGYDGLYNDMLEMLHAADLSYIPQLNKKFQMAAKLANHRWLLSAYVNSGLWLNKIKRKLLSK